jgi:hypothetical protein
MSELNVGHDMACNFELLEGYFRVAAGGEEDDIPVVVTHPSDGVREAFGEQYWSDSRLFATGQRC